jgi:hypothetical protein
VRVGAVQRLGTVGEWRLEHRAVVGPPQDRLDPDLAGRVVEAVLADLVDDPASRGPAA